MRFILEAIATNKVVSRVSHEKSEIYWECVT